MEISKETNKVMDDVKVKVTESTMEVDLSSENLEKYGECVGLFSQWLVKEKWESMVWIYMFAGTTNCS